MGIEVRRCDEHEVRFFAPLNLNKNHKNTVFGGSLTANQALCCWAWIMNLLDEKNIGAHVVIQSNTNQFKRPVDKDFETSCESPSAEELDHFIKTLTAKGRARLKLVSEIKNKGELAVLFEGQYVAMLKD